MDVDVPFMPIDEYEKRHCDDSSFAIIEDEEEEVVTDQNALQEISGDFGCNYIELILEGMGMAKYYPLFHSHFIEPDTLFKLSNSDLMKIGITDEKDRLTILKNFQPFRAAHVNKFDNGKRYKCETNDDDVLMLENVYHHLVEINSHIGLMKLKLRKSNVKDYFVANKLTALKVMKFATNHALIQTNRISKIIYEDSDNLINTTIKINNLSLPQHIKNELVQATAKRRKLRKKPLAILIFAVIGVTLAAVSLSKRHK